MNIIFPSTIARKHGISIEKASRALSLSRRVTKKPNAWIMHIDELTALSSIFCMDCKALGDWHVATKQCRDCQCWHCEKHIEGRRCHCCQELRAQR